jgi:hypothetical protein
VTVQLVLCAVPDTGWYVSGYSTYLSVLPQYDESAVDATNAQKSIEQSDA